MAAPLYRIFVQWEEAASIFTHSQWFVPLQEMGGSAGNMWGLNTAADEEKGSLSVQESLRGAGD